MRRGALCLLIAAATFAVFSRAGGNEFLLYDDAQYITMNPHVARGLTGEGLRWAFTESYAFNWHPLTWLSHMLDRTLFGASARGPHLENALLHAAAASLLFLVLEAMTGLAAAAAFVAAAFALHPLHVQSVAWAAERKDVLSALFWFGTMGAWLRYARRPAAGRYLGVLALFALGLLSKAMAVTLPLVLLLLDFWPLGRLGVPGRGATASGDARRAAWRQALLEKAPLAVLAAGAAALAFRAQAVGGAIHQEVSLLLRAENALVSFVAYLAKTLLPVGLAVHYPYPAGGIPLWQAAGAALLLLGLTIAALRRLARAPWIAVGWGWYLVTLLPVIGIVQIGNQARADRYAYLPLTGVFLAVAWSAAAVARRARGSSVLIAATGLCLACAWAACSWVQLGYWRDGITLFTRALAVTPDNAHARYQLGQSLLREQRFAEALVQLERAVELDPADPHAQNDLGLALSRTGRRGEALAAFARAVRLSPTYADPYLNLAMAHLSLGDRTQALAVWRELRDVDAAAAARLAPYFGAGAAR